MYIDLFILYLWSTFYPGATLNEKPYYYHIMILTLSLIRKISLKKMTETNRVKVLKRCSSLKIQFNAANAVDVYIQNKDRR